jgi:CxxC motif-containing protein (DUF1111 family)
MKLSHVAWCSVIAVLVLGPVGLKALTWHKARQHPADPVSAALGKELFFHEWKENDPLSPGGDGLGPVFNANSCIACHNQAGPGGGGGLEHNVTVFTMRSENRNVPPREGVVHARAVRFQETLAQVHKDLPAVSRPSVADLIPDRGGQRRIGFPRGVHLSQRNTPALFGAKLIDELPDQVIIAQERAQQLRWGLATEDKENLPIGRAVRLGGGRVGHFGWKAQTASLAEFVQAACANELGLGNPGQAQPTPLGKTDYKPRGLDLSQEQCDQITAFVLSLPRPVERPPVESAARNQAEAGKKLFHKIGCADCHTPNVGPIEGLYSDLLLHRMGKELEGGGSYNDPPVPLPDLPPEEGPSPGEWRTPPLWGVADSAPYLHDGRAATLEDAIKLHAGQGAAAAQRFGALAPAEQGWLIVFLKTLRAP